MSELSVGQLKGLTVNSNRINVPSGHTLYAPGHIIQVVHSSLPSTFTAATSGNNFYDCGLSAIITPKFATSKILITFSLFVGTSSYQAKARVVRDGTPIGLGNAEGGRPQATAAMVMYNDNSTTQNYMSSAMSNTILDSPATTLPITYKIQVAAYNTQTIYVNRSVTWQNDIGGGYDAVPSSTMTIMEVAQ